MEHEAGDTLIAPPRHPAPDTGASRPAVADGDTILTGEHAPLGQAAASAPTGERRYRFTVNGHEPISLDRPAHIGRRPALSRVPQRIRPRLVRVPSPNNEVSSTHLEIRQEGTTVIVTDLRSTNGTVVTIPGSPPVALRPGESRVVMPGSLIDIGDGNLVEILALARPTVGATRATSSTVSGDQPQ